MAVNYQRMMEAKIERSACRKFISADRLELNETVGRRSAFYLLRSPDHVADYGSGAAQEAFLSTSLPKNILSAPAAFFGELF